MNLETILFFAFAVAVVVPAVMIILAKDIVRVAFWLLASLSGVAGMFILLGADFLGITQVMVYIGGILVLILFGIMMTQRDTLQLTAGDDRRRSALTGIFISLTTFGALVGMILSTGWKVATEAEPLGRAPGAATIPDIGRALLTDYVLPFEIVSVLLLFVLCGAAYIARRRGEGPSNA